jgi:hypothetical protein
MTTMSTALEFVDLRGGLTVPQAAVDLLLDLERRGVDVHVSTGDRVVCRPARWLTDDDKRAITAHREALKALIAYCEDEALIAGFLSLIDAPGWHVMPATVCAERPTETDTVAVADAVSVTLCPHCGHVAAVHSAPAARTGRVDGGPPSDHYECGQCGQATQNDDGTWTPCPCPRWYPGLTPMQLTAETIGGRAMFIQLADAPPFALTRPVGNAGPCN